MNTIQHSDTIQLVTQKIITVSLAIGGVRKAKMTAGKQYEYFSNEAVLAAVSEQMQQNNLWVLTASDSVEVVEAEYLFHYMFMVIDADSGEYITLPFTQTMTRSDVSANREPSARINDKATGIAHSYAQKTFLLKLFMISTPDADTEQQRKYDEQAHAPAAKATPAPVAPELPNIALINQIIELAKQIEGNDAPPAKRIDLVVKVISDIATEINEPVPTFDTSNGAAFKASLSKLVDAEGLTLVIEQLKAKLEPAKPAKASKPLPKA